jgi:pyridoxine 5-phosphate synthase
MRLGINIDHIATLRQARRINLISPIQAAKICLEGGADSIVAHLREDRRHIQDKDIYELREKINCPLNMEMSINNQIVNVAMEARPNVSTLVPERRQELTTEGGLDIVGNQRKISQVVRKLQSRAIKVSLFIDPKETQIQAARDIGAQIIELHTGNYAQARNAGERKKTLEQLKITAAFGRKLGLKVAAGHGLDYSNVLPIAKIKDIEELNIGYSIICQAVFVGLFEAVKQMRMILDKTL